MAQSRRSRLVRMPKQEEEIHVISNPLDMDEPSLPMLPLTRLQKQREVLTTDDYQAPLTSFSLQPHSRWLIVRRNLHRIRFMGFNSRGRQSQLPDFYLGFQMTRELKRAQDEIKNVDKQKDFYAIKQFTLAGELGTKKVFNTGHVTPDDALIYDRLGEEPLALQNLLFYFSKQEVEYGTVFWDFLSEVNHALNLKRKRSALVQRLRRVALWLAIILYVCIGLMFCLMIISVITTATKLNDPEVEWTNESRERYAVNVLAFR
ncbi:unnamed protein product [Rotaria socialis]|uniref:Uncharacterized protein n=1 Tax=Rotaria socialis TaxID=392032 RepID=A0A817Q545_9BILA|nr:unnamed protein product [Rotaria socialis]CAF3367031.1 unnamed protein product [Rotaria socialis]CAF3491105.1 unnamed protein product [Rotaria socialis]CAF3707062.1 unnamed protein product [Rotaria socialis]CAF3730710.1 unnamed protein product [Rotaria socialis]